MFKKTNFLYVIIIFGLFFLIIAITQIGNTPFKNKNIALMISYSIFAVIYLAALAWYIRSVLIEPRRKKDRPRSYPSPFSLTPTSSSPSSSSSSSSSSTSSSSGKKHSRHRRGGKRCPKCKEIIDQRRNVCHHCGHKFKSNTVLEAHPDEMKKEQKNPPSDEES